MSEPASPMKTRAGWKLWRRKPRQAPASAAASTAAPPRLSESARIANVEAVIAPMPAARPSIPSMKLKLFISATIQSIVTGYCSAPRSSAPQQRQREVVDRGAGGDRDRGRRQLADELDDRVDLEAVVEQADRGAHARAEQDRVRAAAQRRLQQQHRAPRRRRTSRCRRRTGSAPSAGAGPSCDGRPGRSGSRACAAIGVSQSASTPASANATSASRRACVTGAPSRSRCAERSAGPERAHAEHERARAAASSAAA